MILSHAGNVLRSHTAAKLAFRVPPNVDAYKAAAAVKEVLEKVNLYPFHRFTCSSVSFCLVVDFTMG